MKAARTVCALLALVSCKPSAPTPVSTQQTPPRADAELHAAERSMPSDAGVPTPLAAIPEAGALRRTCVRDRVGGLRHARFACSDTLLWFIAREKPPADVLRGADDFIGLAVTGTTASSFTWSAPEGTGEQKHARFKISKSANGDEWLGVAAARATPRGSDVAYCVGDPRACPILASDLVEHFAAWQNEIPERKHVVGGVAVEAPARCERSLSVEGQLIVTCATKPSCVFSLTKIASLAHDTKRSRCRIGAKQVPCAVEPSGNGGRARSVS